MKDHKAKLILIQMEALNGEFEGRTADLMALINEILRDSKALAEEVLEENKEKVA